MTTWREMARELAHRLQYSEGGCDHDPKLAHKTAAECPFCADWAAYTHWLRKETMEKNRRARRDQARA